MSEKVKKDVIYVDVEDDITDVVNKIKSSKERIIAIVPPKSLGIFRSAVNIRLLSRAAQKNDKKIVFITNNSALKTMVATLTQLLSMVRLSMGSQMQESSKG